MPIKRSSFHRPFVVVHRAGSKLWQPAGRGLTDSFVNNGFRLLNCVIGGEARKVMPMVLTGYVARRYGAIED